MDESTTRKTTENPVPTKSADDQIVEWRLKYVLLQIALHNMIHHIDDHNYGQAKNCAIKTNALIFAVMGDVNISKEEQDSAYALLRDFEENHDTYAKMGLERIAQESNNGR